MFAIVCKGALASTLVCFSGMLPQSTPTPRPAPDLDLAGYVNPFIGTNTGGPDYGLGNEGGHVFPGAVYPQGMVQWSPDTTHAAGGYRYSQTAINGFSLTHFSGRGCSAYQDFPFMPVLSPLRSSPGTNWQAYASGYSHTDEAAAPGFYHVRLATSIGVDLAVTPRTGLGVFTYPASKAATMLINAGGSATGDAEMGTGVQILPPDEVETSATSGHFCGGANTYTVHMIAQFDRPFSAFGTWSGAQLTPGAAAGNGARSGAYLQFDTTGNPVVRVRVGLSFVSAANARLNLVHEDAGWNQVTVRRAARAAWNSVLNRIRVSGGTPDEKTIFYTALYHALLHPNVFGDVNRQYMGFDGRVHTARGYMQYENFAGWDIYRSELPLLAMLVPDTVSDMMHSLVADAAQGGGGLPRWEVANGNSGGMVGDSADVLIASAYAFGARHFDAHGALQAMERGATDPQARSGPYQPRPGLLDDLKFGYIPSGSPGVWGSAATTLEYATDDFCIAQLARALNDKRAYSVYLNRSTNWQNLFNPATGFIERRNRDGSFPATYDPTSEDGFVEGDGAQYTWLVPYDLPGLFQAMGGPAQVIQRLDRHFTQLNAGPTSPYAFLGNEPELETPWEYDFAGKPARTQAVVRRIELDLFHNSPSGLVGNDDGGAMASWYVWAALGLYPEVPGVAGFAVGSPLFPSVEVRLAHGHVLRIDGRGASNAAPYVQKLSLNGRPYNRSWIPFVLVERGGLLDALLGPKATAWGDQGPAYGDREGALG